MGLNFDFVFLGTPTSFTEAKKEDFLNLNFFKKMNKYKTWKTKVVSPLNVKLLQHFFYNEQ